MMLNLDSTAQTLSASTRATIHDHDTLPSSHRRGENGHAELTAEGLGDALLALFDKIVRGLDEARISSFVADIIAEARTKGDPELLKNLFVLAFQTRWCRGGKGERNVFYHLLVVLYERDAACWWTLWSSFQRTDRGETCSTFSSSAIMATWTMPPCVTRYETCLHAS